MQALGHTFGVHYSRLADPDLPQALGIEGSGVFSGTMPISEPSSFPHCPANVKGPVLERLASILFSEAAEADVLHTGLLVLKERLLHHRLFHLSEANLCRSQIFTI